jgi:hypothetical protein
MKVFADGDGSHGLPSMSSLASRVAVVDDSRVVSYFDLNGEWDPGVPGGYNNVDGDTLLAAGSRVMAIRKLQQVHAMTHPGAKRRLRGKQLAPDGGASFNPTQKAPPARPWTRWREAEEEIDERIDEEDRDEGR